MPIALSALRDLISLSSAERKRDIRPSFVVLTGERVTSDSYPEVCATIEQVRKYRRVKMVEEEEGMKRGWLRIWL